MKGTGLRYNLGKTMMGLMPPFAAKAIGEILTKGAVKYTVKNEDGSVKIDGRNNWKNGMSWADVLDSLERHLNAFKSGIDFDPEDKMLHMAKVAVNAIFLTEYYHIYPEGDDRRKPQFTLPKIGLDVDQVICNFVHGYAQMFCLNSKPTNYLWTYRNKEYFEQIAYDYDFWVNLPRMLDPDKMPFEPHCYISHRPFPTYWTENWIEQNGFPCAPVIHTETSSKLQACRDAGVEWFVDDRFENFAELNDNGITCFLMDAPHNRRYNVGHLRIYSLSDLVTGSRVPPVGQPEN